MTFLAPIRSHDQVGLESLRRAFAWGSTGLAVVVLLGPASCLCAAESVVPDASCHAPSAAMPAFDSACCCQDGGNAGELATTRSSAEVQKRGSIVSVHGGAATASTPRAEPAAAAVELSAISRSHSPPAELVLPLRL